MDPQFTRFLESLEPKYQALVEMAPVKYKTLPRVLPSRGIYLFSEGEKHLYVGRTTRLRDRLYEHRRPSSNHFQATFAFLLAREQSGKTEASYSKSGSRPELLNNETFASAFKDAKRRVASMDIRFVEESDPTRQALLEIYTATVLKTPYNDFDTH